MNYTEQNYENVARYMDGENLSLDTVELALLDEVRGDMLVTAKAMDTTVDSEVIDRVLRRHRKSPWRLVTGLTAAAAVVVLAVAAWMLTANNVQPKQPATAVAAAGTNEVVETLATVQSILDAQQELDIITILVQNDAAAEQTPAATTTDDDTWDMTAWTKDLAS